MTTCSVDRSLLERLHETPAVKAVYGRMFAYGLPTTGSDTVSSMERAASITVSSPTRTPAATLGRLRPKAGIAAK